MKRAVNMLLKNIDRISLVRDGVLLIGATNHPQLLDEAAWRRFDEVVEFVLPDQQMRLAILQSVTQSFTIDADLNKIALETEGFSGADLRILIKEALISALVEDRNAINSSDVEAGIALVHERNSLKSCRWA
jgi:AAA+ superfamily predicted ATPase